MKNFKFDYGQPLAIVALLLVLSTAFAFFEEPISPPTDARKIPGTDLTRSPLAPGRQEKAKDLKLRLNAGDTPDAANKQRESPLILAEDK
ncbi:hypothetical protein [Prosthecobacter algae]